MDIWSLLPRATEVLFALGLADHIFHLDPYRKAPPLISVLKLVSPPAGASSVENWTPRLDPLLAGVS